MLEPPPLLAFDTSMPGPKILPSPTVILPSATGHHTYVLCGAIYMGDYHFSTRLLDVEDRVWLHDGQIASGHPRLDAEAS